jgi:hypothetical protein
MRQPLLRTIRVELPQLSPATRQQYRTVSESPDDGDGAGDGNADDGDADDDADDESGLTWKAARARSPSPELGGVLSIIDGHLYVKGLPTDLNASLDRFVKEVPDKFKEAQRWMAENRPVISGLPQVEELLPRLPISETWTTEDRQRIESRWADDRKKAKLRDSDVKGKRELLILYKACLCLMRCLPKDIIGCRFKMEYDKSQNHNWRRRGRSTGWTPLFCKTLTRLLVHPMWKGSIALLAAAIQYAIIVDTDDHGPWETPVPSTCDWFLSDLLQRKQLRPGTSAIEHRRELHDQTSTPEVDEFGLEIGTAVYSTWDVLFQTLEAAVRPDRQRPPQRSGPFQVHRRHLGMLEKALDDMPHMGFPMFLPVEGYHHAIGGCRSARDYPQQGDLVALRSYEALCELERLAYKAKLTAQGQVDNRSSSGIPDLSKPDHTPTPAPGLDAEGDPGPPVDDVENVDENSGLEDEGRYDANEHSASEDDYTSTPAPSLDAEDDPAPAMDVVEDVDEHFNSENEGRYDASEHYASEDGEDGNGSHVELASYAESADAVSASSDNHFALRAREMEVDGSNATSNSEDYFVLRAREMGIEGSNAASLSLAAMTAGNAGLGGAETEVFAAGNTTEMLGKRREHTAAGKRREECPTAILTESRL